MRRGAGETSNLLTAARDDETGGGRDVVRRINRPGAASSADRFAMLALICLGVVLSITPWFSATAILPELRDTWSMSPALAAVMAIAVQAGFVPGALGMGLVNLADIVAPVRLMSVGAALALVYPPAMKLTTTWFVKGRGLDTEASADASDPGTNSRVRGLGFRTDRADFMRQSATSRRSR